MPRPKTDLKSAHFRLGAADLAALDKIAKEAARRTRRPASRTDALRWAVRELGARLWMGRASAAAGEDALWPAGPATAPPGAGG